MAAKTTTEERHEFQPAAGPSCKAKSGSDEGKKLCDKAVKAYAIIHLCRGSRKLSPSMAVTSAWVVLNPDNTSPCQNTRCCHLLVLMSSFR
jgi:hypothetical protein